jgi:cytochrome o ubiquinol oxidase subunit 2
MQVWASRNKMNFQLFNPKGFIAEQQSELLIMVPLLLLVGAVPALVLLYTFAWKYRAANKKTKHAPNWNHPGLEKFLWVFLSSIILVLAVTAIKSSHALDPRKPIESNVSPLTIQAVALEWKWLFIYPDQEIATVNYLRIPEDTPINFEITADAPMNSLWIPQLGGQMYAMNGMRTKLHLIADETGTYRGQSSNISGEGFSGMRFNVEATSKSDFNAWVATTKFYGDNLNYEEVAKKSENEPAATYGFVPAGLFDQIVTKFISEGHQH